MVGQAVQLMLVVISSSAEGCGQCPKGGATYTGI